MRGDPVQSPLEAWIHFHMEIKPQWMNVLHMEIYAPENAHVSVKPLEWDSEGRERGPLGADALRLHSPCSYLRGGEPQVPVSAEQCVKGRSSLCFPALVRNTSNLLARLTRVLHGASYWMCKCRGLEYIFSFVLLLYKSTGRSII